MARDQNNIGSYRLLKLVRAGASSQIWEVMDEVRKRRCALKTLQDDYRADREEIALLKHEFLVGEQLDHPSVIQIYAFDVFKGIPYLALEYFESHNLKQWSRAVSEGQIEGEGDLASIIRQAAEGLNYLHQQGWIHRDVKPDNFLVNHEMKVKLIDFAIAERIKTGIAKLLAGKSKIQGTRSYMSPEQIRGERLDPSSDVYSFGCMLYELFSGRPPFTGGSPDELLQKHLRAPVPSLAASNPNVTSEFVNLVASMMSKQREKRPKSMQEFLDQSKSMRVVRIARK